MKFFAVVVLCTLAAAVKAGMTKEESIEAFHAAAAVCAAETGATEADIEVVKKCLPSQNKETKCFRACIMKKFEVMNADGKFNKDAALKMAEIHIQGDAKKMEIAKEITSFCSEIAVPDDHCEAAELYKMCLADEAKKHGINIMK